MHYDYLVIALGNVTNFYGMPGMLENAIPFKTLADAMVLRNHVIRTLEEADVEEDPELRRKLLTFVVGGGGFSGVEVIAELNDFVRAVKGNYLRLRNQPHRCGAGALAQPHPAGDGRAVGAVRAEDAAQARSGNHSRRPVGGRDVRRRPS